MPLMMSLALALVAAGAAVSLTTYVRAPVSNEMTGWNLAFMGGISIAALGGLGVMLSAMTS